MSQLHLAVGLEGAGWHPAAWRDPAAAPHDLLSAAYWTELVAVAERGLLDLVTIEDGLALQSERDDAPDGRTDRVRGRLDAVLTAARVAPTTRHIGLVPSATVTHTEPFHLSKAVATLDYVSTGRAGLRVQASLRPFEARHFGRREVSFVPRQGVDIAGDPLVVDLLGEVVDYVEVLRRLWDSWEDDAEIRDVATGRFVDIEKLHYIDFEGKHFSVRGPSITPRPPQGQPLVVALAHGPAAYAVAGRAADVAIVTPHSLEEARAAVEGVAAERSAAARTDGPGHVLGDLAVVLGATTAEAQDRLARLDELAGEPWSTDVDVIAGTPTELADRLQDWASAGLDGYRLRPAVLATDLAHITTGLVPELQRRGAFRTAYTASTLRGHFGLPRPANRYAAV
ncbi:alkanesulfonate monooxygenase SsuD/methylene tetrahydromethanopterin reductase-like flavin-dependent oxidoreductase (luciferase family) [Motilibacter rhizosphaerae]|uniref:Alkanesulfonate monooxygenase SsuD/methylene tetrahydromethanopterin reductase-like flavin-dependent oxidoreductase (Luciferase family) n=1 Tax=Motilibacter rhizosphaerae TaxID=598652 RepID=A0A4Q7NST2_9ACTN|nr:LLM class flavin-dependent oxidoreductase [Motilibacter rhizosphaerae]RZS89920.1 alkanesulfonate monooxygenase SsuD/methylene tetrahydromethanopterin reductase-like flavin-dependent oxidoreductase (luciferase family) [Motilibacter rhizosphaerae]